MRWPFRSSPPAASPRVEPIIAPIAARGMRIDMTDVAYARAPLERPAEKAWTIAKPLPGVVPDGAPTLAQDDGFSSLYSFMGGLPYDDGSRWLGYPILAELSQRPEFRRISEILAKEMTRKWIRLRSTSDDDKRDKLRALDAAMKRFRVQQHFRRLTEIDGFFGSARLYLDTGAGNDRDELASPLLRNRNKIRRGALKRLRVIEPMWTYPAEYNSFDPLAPGFYTPRAWYLQGKRIDSSRLLTFVAREVPDLLKPAYSFGGISMSQLAMPYVENWLRTRQSVSDLVHSFAVSGIKTNMMATLAESPEGGDVLRKRVEMFGAYRDNKNTLLLDKDTEEFFNVSTPLGTLDKLLAQSQEQQASVSGIPLVVLLGITPSGLNASSDGEIRSFYAWVAAQQEQLYSDNLQAVIEVIQLSEFGEVDPDITFGFEPLWELDDTARSTIRKTDADTAIAYINAGVLSPKEERERLAAEESSIYVGLDVDAMPEPPDLLGGGDPDNAPPEDDEADPGAKSDDDAGDHVVVPLRRAANDGLAQDKEWSEGDHPRGQPGNAGQFGPGGGAAAPPSRAKPEPTARGRTSSQTPSAGGQTRSQTGAGGTSKAALQPTRMEGTTRVQANGEPLPAHIAALKVPPGWADVRFNPDAGAALLATGRDAKGRPTAIYSEAFSAAQAAQKFARVHELMTKFPAIVKQNDAARADPQTRDVADCLDLIMKMGIRPGSEADTGAKVKAYGATTLEGRHVVRGADGAVSLQFVGKKGVALNLPVEDKALAASLVARAKAAGDTGKLFGGVSDAKLLDHTHSMNGGKFKTKDMRTHLGTATAAKLVATASPPKDAKAYKTAVMQIAKQVSARLGNTPTIALQSYISPAVFSRWQGALA